jgi:urease accessory protein
MLALCIALRDNYSIAAVTNDIFTRSVSPQSVPNNLKKPKILTNPTNSEDQEFLVRRNALPAARIKAIETGGCPHAAVREDISANLHALEDLHREFQTDILLIESGGDNLAANYSRELADFIIYVVSPQSPDRQAGMGLVDSEVGKYRSTYPAAIKSPEKAVQESRSQISSSSTKLTSPISSAPTWPSWTVMQGRCGELHTQVSTPLKYIHESDMQAAREVPRFSRRSRTARVSRILWA